MSYNHTRAIMSNFQNEGYYALVLRIRHIITCVINDYMSIFQYFL